MILVKSDIENHVDDEVKRLVICGNVWNIGANIERRVSCFIKLQVEQQVEDQVRRLIWIEVGIAPNVKY